MKRKQILSALLSAALLAADILPASAAALSAESPTPSSPAVATDERLAQVTATVKNTLGIGDEYEDFYGELQENKLAPVWSLNWSREDDRLEVEATESGKIIRYYTSESLETSPSPTGWSFPPAFPAHTQEEAKASAEAFLKKVLDASLESARFEDRGAARMSTENYRFGGTILLNSLPSPLSFSLTVRASDGKVTRFSRDVLEGQSIGDVPSAKPNTAEADAGELLKNTLDLRLEYVLDPDTNTANLCYLPEPMDEYYIDAASGELVNLTKLYEELQERGDSGDRGIAFNTSAATPEAAMDMAAGGLSQAELSGISKMEGVLSKEDLDNAMRKLAPLGLDRYTLASASYSLDQETGGVTARLRYTHQEQENTWNRTVTCDGKTAELKAVSSSAPYIRERTESVSADEARKSGEAFLTQLWGVEFTSAALYKSSPQDVDSRDIAYSFQYAQQENGYFFPENSLSVGVDITDGSISFLNRSWTEDVAFDSPDGILSKVEAMDTWFQHYDLAMGYLLVPVALDPDFPEAAPLLDMGVAYFYTPRLGYGLEDDGFASGVDAKTGGIIRRDLGSSVKDIAYTDLDNHWARPQLERLAQYGVGWPSEVCKPDSELTQLDLLVLILSADGYAWSGSEDDTDWLYSRAYDLGLLTRAQRKEDLVLTRGETVKMLLDASGCAAVAKLPDIFTCAFADRDSIPADLLGYAALAQGMKVVSSENFDASATATRAQAAVMLYNLMARAERGVSSVTPAP